MCVYMYICVYVRMYVYMYICILCFHEICVYIHTYIYIYIYLSNATCLMRPPLFCNKHTPSPPTKSVSLLL